MELHEPGSKKLPCCERASRFAFETMFATLQRKDAA